MNSGRTAGRGPLRWGASTGAGPTVGAPTERFPRTMPTSVVTGGAGFLGSHLCDALLERGDRVLCVDNLDTGSLTNIEHLRRDDFVFVQHDLVTHLEISEPVDNVFHLASPASPIDYLRLPLHTLKVGAYGTHNALGLAKRHRARFLIASTSEVYGDPLVHPQPESYWGNVNPIGPRGVYDEAKRYAEAMTMAYHRQQGVDTAIVRIFNTYGPRMRAHDGRAIPTFVRQALEGKPITVFGDGSQTRSFCYVSDLIAGHRRAQRVERARAGEHREPERVHAARAGPRRCSRSPARPPRSCSRRSRSTIPSSGDPTSPARGSCSAGSRTSSSPRDSGCCSTDRPALTSSDGWWARDPPYARRLCGLIVACALGVVAAASAADARRQDEGEGCWRRRSSWASRTTRRSSATTTRCTPDIQALEPQVFRFTIFWSQIAKKRAGAGPELRRSRLRLVEGRRGRQADERRCRSPCCSRSSRPRRGPAAVAAA